ncbi:MAG: signal peptidase I [Cyanobacteria bacterium P01_F01_bin.13]
MDSSSFKFKNTNPWLYGVLGIGINSLLAFGLPTYVFEARYIPTGAMQPTLERGDRLLIEKFSYLFREPKRKDIIVFPLPEGLLQDDTKDYAVIFRIIGLPGDTVEIFDGTVFINANALDEDYILEQPNYRWGPEVVPVGSYFTLADNRNNSFDGHAWGFVDKDNIIGRSVFRFWPLQRIGKLE